MDIWESDEPLSDNCQDLADIMQERLDGDDHNTSGADCDDLRKDYERVYGSDRLTVAYDAADAANQISG